MTSPPRHRDGAVSSFPHAASALGIPTRGLWHKKGRPKSGAPAPTYERAIGAIARFGATTARGFLGGLI